MTRMGHRRADRLRAARDGLGGLGVFGDTSPVPGVDRRPSDFGVPVPINGVQNLRIGLKVILTKINK